MNVLQRLEPLTDEERVELDYISRRVVATRSINMSELEDLVAWYLLMDVRPITTSALCELTGYSRRSLSVALNDLETMGMALRPPDGWVLTELGRDILTQVHRETRLIALRQLGGYSGGLLERLRSLPTGGVKRPFTADDD